MRQVKWQVSGSGKQQVNVSLKSTAIGLGDKVMDLIKTQKAWRTESEGQQKALLEAISGLEMALTKQRAMSSAETGTVPVMHACEPSSGAIPAMPPPVGPPPRQTVPAMAPPVAPPAMPPQQIYGAPTTYGAAAGETAGPRQYVEAAPEPGVHGLPAAFQRPPGYGHQAKRVQIQGQYGQSRVRAISPGCIRVGENPPPEWSSEFGLGNIRVGNVLHRIIPDHFLDRAEPYPGL